uniref:Uncharacterized protein At5g65660-like isoform X2 n=1 Tax=Nicotiana tabacum TaxID=4097 RepID=A0A1S4D2A4_TOBAC|nr:PREDICTED: uncharacterized protein At5g65660-like isoform X2 [Nicotiana tabacum]
MTENQYYAPSHSDPSRPSLGFPLGTALLLLIIFSLSGIFSCCYHWDKLRSLRRSFSDSTDLEAELEAKPNIKYAGSVDAWRSSTKVHSIAMSMSASPTRKGSCRDATAAADFSSEATSYGSGSNFLLAKLPRKF